MAAANIACLLVQHKSDPSDRVLLMDWDLEAPGLHHFFASAEARSSEPGIINYFCRLVALLNEREGLYKQLVSDEGVAVLTSLLPLEEFVISDVANDVDLIKAGTFDSEYSKLVNSFDWLGFHAKFGGAIQTLRNALASKYAHILVDSRTGLNDVSGICTMLLPEKLVGVFMPNKQSLYGLLDLVRKAVEFRRASDDFRPLTVFPLPSRIELAEKLLREQWRRDYQRLFELLFKELFEMTECDLSYYFDEVQIPHVSYYAFGEEIAVLQEERSDTLSLSRAYRAFFDRLTVLNYPWEKSDKLLKVDVAIPVEAQPATYAYDAFLSYGAVQTNLVGVIANRLRQLEARVFFDRWEIFPGDPVVQRVSEALRSSRGVIFLVGHEAITRRQLAELEQAVAIKNERPDFRIIPARVGQVTPPLEAMPPVLRGVEWADLRSPEDDDEFRRVVAALKRK